MTTMSSTSSTVRSAVLNGVFSGTRSMPNLMSVIFMGWSSWHVFMRRRSSMGRRSGSDADDVGDAVDVGLGGVELQWRQRRHRHGIEMHRMQLAVGAEVTAAVGVVDHVG